MLSNTSIAKILDMTPQGVGKWRKENRPIIHLLNKYFTKEDLEEFVNSGEISKMELLQVVENSITNDCIELIKAFNELEAILPSNFDLFIAQVFKNPSNTISTLSVAYPEWKTFISQEEFKLDKLIEVVIKKEFLTKLVDFINFSKNQNLENILYSTNFLEDKSYKVTAIKLYLFYNIYLNTEISDLKTITLINSFCDDIKELIPNINNESLIKQSKDYVILFKEKESIINKERKDFLNSL